MRLYYTNHSFSFFVTILQCLSLLVSREKKRERERDDLWRKMQDLSLKNAAKEGISLGTGID